MATNMLPRTQAGTWLDKQIDARRINLEVIAYVVLITLSVIAHLWGLGVMALHHDESVHAFPTWSLYQGRGGFTCYNGEASEVYCYDPVYHGPSLYFFMMTSFFLFGGGDFQARLPMALAGIGLVASCIMLRPYFGKWGAFIAAVVLGFAPSLLYYTRFARHDAFMILWELWMVIGFLRFVDTGKRRWLVLLAAAIALAMGTHELYYILFFIFGTFVLVRGFDESRFYQKVPIVLGGLLALCAVLMIFNPPLPVGSGLFLGDKAMLIAVALVGGLLIRRVWDPRPVLLPRLRALWFEDRMTLWVALGVLAAVYVVQYSSFFAYPPGIIDGLYAGLAYWLGSQHEFARGDQPWYYYLILMPIYEPLGLVGAFATSIVLLCRKLIWPQAKSVESKELAESESEQAEVEEVSKQVVLDEEGVESVSDTSSVKAEQTAAAVAERRVPLNPVPLAALLLIFWFFNALVDFSWAGEKMPWLVVHISLPANLLAIWGLAALGRWGFARFTSAEEETPELEQSRKLSNVLVPCLTVAFLFVMGLALWRLGGVGDDRSGQSSMLQGVVQLIVSGALLYTILTIASKVGYRRVLTLATITLAAFTGAYMLRASWLVVYDHPDTPIEPLVYVQTSPGIPLLVEELKLLSTNLTRNQRTREDITGAYSMPIIIDSGDPKADGEGSLAWPMQWYLRDFKSLNWRSTETFRDAPSANSFDVVNANSITEQAPVVLLYKQHVTSEVRSVLEANYVQRSVNLKLNWWFPEGDKCRPEGPGYKRFYFNTWMDESKIKRDCGQSADPSTFHSPLAPLLYPFQPENWSTIGQYMLYRELPEPLELNGRDMEVWIRNDLMGMSGSSTGGSSSGSAQTVRLLADIQIGQPGTGEGQLNQPANVAVAQDGTIYVSDTFNNRIQVFDAEGNFLRSIGEFGGGDGQFIEPRGIDIDDEGLIYVADTWNARIVKMNAQGEFLATWGTGDQDLGNGRKATITDGTPDANLANPLGFFGPRGIALDGNGHLFIADTGNKRIVVTTLDGEYVSQFGTSGSGLGSFNEPTGVAIDRAKAMAYIADTWNGRVQAFRILPDGGVDVVPAFAWPVRGWQANTYEDPSIAVGPNGEVLVSVPSARAVSMTNGQGEALLRWGGSGNDLASLNGPSGMGVDANGLVYVVDRLDGRVLRFELPRLRVESTP
jgi:uncharacterized protein (TIGR03663 family)